MIQEQARTEKLLDLCDDFDGKVGVPVVLLVDGLDNLQHVSENDRMWEVGDVYVLVGCPQECRHLR